MTIDDLLKKWLGREGGAERANYQMFLTELALALGLPAPDAKGQGIGDYEFEAPVRSEAVYGGRGTKRIDLYKRGCFILEAKQSQLTPGEAAHEEPDEAETVETLYDLFGTPIGVAAPARGAPRRRYDRLMEGARIQAQRYALALPENHPFPPFLIVADIGRAFELYFDFAGNGRGYRPFPDERGYRIGLADLASAATIAGIEAEGRPLTAAETLRAIWTDPARIDPRTRAAKVTREIATMLSEVAAQLEKDQRTLRPGDAEIALGIEATSLFLMRTLFCMFAEDVGLLPKDSFKTFLSDAEGRSDQFWRTGLEDLWRRMNSPAEGDRYWPQGDAIVRYFNGNLFSGAKVYDLPGEFKRRLRVAADQDWRAVEPAIFGTLLEQVLTSADRAKLGAHYTPRAYVDRLVQATVMDVLTPEWERVREAAMALLNPPRALLGGDQPKAGGGAAAPAAGNPSALRIARGAGGPSTASRSPSPSKLGEERDAALSLACAFHERLAATRVLDPACGTGNFLYVAMEALLRLESEVRQFVVSLGGTLAPAVHPNQFLGLELNPRTAVIAELVLWIGWLRYRLANKPDAIGEPVLPPLTNINGGTHGGYDAVLARTAIGEPDAENPRRPVWPEADFIVGNPPFIGGKDVRERLGSAYAEALWKANPRVPKSADFVMQWWDRAADILTRPGTRLRRFGLVTTNSITQVFSRRVIEGWLAPNPPRASLGEGDQPEAGGGADAPAAVDLSAVANAPDAGGPSTASPSPSPSKLGEDQAGKLHLVLAIPDHPWTRVTKDAAAVRIAMTVAEAGAGTGTLVEILREGALDTDDPVLEELRVVGRINDKLGLGESSSAISRLSANLPFRVRGVEFHGDGFVLKAETVKEWKEENPAFYDTYVKPYVALNDYKIKYLNRFVVDLFGVSERGLRQSAPKLYQHLLRTAYPSRQNNEVAFRRENWWMLALPHVELRSGLAGVAEVIFTPITARYRWFVRDTSLAMPDQSLLAIFLTDWADLGILSSRIHEEWFVENCGWLGVGNDPRYNPTRVFDTFAFPALEAVPRTNVANIAEELHATREAAMVADAKLTMSGLYRLVNAIRDGTLPPAQEAAATRARAFIVAKLHDDLDSAVADAYGWGEEWRRAPLPPAEIVRRLVALNAERAAEEAQGQVRWLRPEYQRPRFGRSEAES